MKRVFLYFFISLFFYFFISSFLSPVQAACGLDAYGVCGGTCTGGTCMAIPGYSACYCWAGSTPVPPTSTPTPPSGCGCSNPTRQLIEVFCPPEVSLLGCNVNDNGRADYDLYCGTTKCPSGLLDQCIFSPDCGGSTQCTVTNCGSTQVNGSCGGGTCENCYVQTATITCPSPIGYCGDVCTFSADCGTNCGPTPTSGGGPTPTRTPTPTPTPTPTNTPTPTPTPTPVPGSWVKLKNSSFISANSLLNNIPLIPVAYDADDDGTANFIIGAGGVVGAPSVNITGTNANAKTSSPNEYKVTGYTPSYIMTPSSFHDYIKARKQHIAITSLGQITADGIYLWEGAYPLNINDSNKIWFDNYKVVFIATGQVNIDTDAGLNPSNGSLAIIAPTITFTNLVEEANGIFIANDIITGSPANQGLKIIGNLIALESLTNDREWTNGNIPSLFIVFDQEKYIDLLPYLSTANYDWRQIQ